MSKIETLDLLWCKLIVATMGATTPEFSITLNKEECMEAIKGMESLKESLNDLNSLVKCIAESPKKETPKTETMTLEQAIEHLEEELKNKEDWSCVACKEEHEQLLEWLKELQAIKNAEPSEALELVGYLKDYHLNAMPYYDWLNDIEKYILKAQEQEKIFNLKITKTLEAFYFLNENFKISVYHTRHNDTGYEMSITDNDKKAVYCEDVSEEVYLIFKELKND